MKYSLLKNNNLLIKVIESGLILWIHSKCTKASSLQLRIEGPTEKILKGNNKNFDKILDRLLLKRKNKVQLKTVSVSSIIKDVKKNGDKALIKYEKRYNKNSIIFPSPSKISKSIL